MFRIDSLKYTGQIVLLDASVHIGIVIGDAAVLFEKTFTQLNSNKTCNLCCILMRLSPIIFFLDSWSLLSLISGLFYHCYDKG